jgi:hypothetical protein
MRAQKQTASKKTIEGKLLARKRPIQKKLVYIYHLGTAPLFHNGLMCSQSGFSRLQRNCPVFNTDKNGT